MKIPGFSTVIMDESSSHLDKVIVKDELYISTPSDKFKDSLQMKENLSLSDITDFVKKLTNMREEAIVNEI